MSYYLSKIPQGMWIWHRHVIHLTGDLKPFLIVREGYYEYGLTLEDIEVIFAQHNMKMTDDISFIKRYLLYLYGGIIYKEDKLVSYGDVKENYPDLTYLFKKIKTDGLSLYEDLEILGAWSISSHILRMISDGQRSFITRVMYPSTEIRNDNHFLLTSKRPKDTLSLSVNSLVYSFLGGAIIGWLFSKR